MVFVTDGAVEDSVGCGFVTDGAVEGSVGCGEGGEPLARGCMCERVHVCSCGEGGKRSARGWTVAIITVQTIASAMNETKSTRRSSGKTVSSMAANGFASVITTWKTTAKMPAKSEMALLSPLAPLSGSVSVAYATAFLVK